MRGEDVRFEILNFLDKKEKASFEEIIKGVKAARRTVDKYLRELYDKNGFVSKEYGKRGKYYPTKDGKDEVQRQRRIRHLKEQLEKSPEQLKDMENVLDALAKHMRVDAESEEQIKKRMARQGIKIVGPIFWLKSERGHIDPNSVRVMSPKKKERKA